ncbi:MAG: HAMP domain-containing sensor histidine kinase [Acidobacteriota bacterium]
MTRRVASWSVRSVTIGLTFGVCVSVGALLWFGYRAVYQWERSATLLAESRASESVDMLVKALSSDMRGVQEKILSSPGLDEFILDPPYHLRNLAASAFARYPYPEAFFAWRVQTPPNAMTFFNRADRPPPWAMAAKTTDPFPVTVGEFPSVGRMLFDRIRLDADRGRRFSIFEMTVAGVPYQVVARLLYRDAFREQLEGVFGFTVNLPWVRQRYFSEVTSQVARIRPSEGSASLAVVDDRGARVAGAALTEAGGQTFRRWFPLMFFDPLLIAPDPPSDLSRDSLGVQVGLRDSPALAAATTAASRTLVMAALAAAALALGLVLSVRAARASAELAGMRSDFVSTVTHELKTPIATIRAIGDTLVSGRVTGQRAFADYAQLVVQEAKRLGRLVDNLLAYARVTDVTEVYAFEPLDLAVVIEDVIDAFRVPLEEQRFSVEIEMPADLPPVRGDRMALTLMFDNLVDNAIRYSGDVRMLAIRARREGRTVQIDVRDRGVGIPETELAMVTRKFYRGRSAGSGGSGLGLSIAVRIVRDHRGALTIASVVDAGTTVGVTLPLAERSA